ncbi:MAG: transporter [Verrucomicrobia bacterium]|nr:transporter [Verrucomicrobiota bacterium]
MKIQLKSVLLLGGLLALPSLLQAQPTAHYITGFEGIKGASLPPPGVYLRDYTIGYYASRLNTASGQDTKTPNFRAYTIANVPRVLWITETKFLGGFVGVDALLPLVYQNLQAGPGPAKSDTFGIGDFFAESTLSWHTKQFDFAVAAGLHMPTGDSPNQPYEFMTRAGLGYWTPMLTAGATWYIDQEKTWAVSALNRYEFNTEQRNTQVTPGQAYTLEWGVSKTLNKTIDVGVVGYYQQKVTTDTGANAVKFRDRVAAVGPEVSVAFPKPMLFVSLRYDYEFMAESRAQGHTFALTLTKRF